MADFYMSNVTGLLDIDSMVKGLLQVKQQAIAKLNNKKALLQAKASSLSNLLGAINDLKDFSETWDIDALFKGKTVSSSNTDVLTASVTEDAPNLSMKIEVNQLPQAEIRASSTGVANLGDSLSAANFTLRYYTSDSEYEEFDINFGGGTLEDLVEAINQAQDRVEASVYYDGTSYKLMLSEKDVGDSTKETTDTSSVIEISSGSLPAELGSLETIQDAQNARLLIGSGSEVSSPTNTFENLVNGLTVTVKDLGEATVTISEDYSKASSGIEELFKKVNAVVDLVNSLTKKGALFQGNGSITQIKSQIFRALNPLIKLGVVNIGDDGKYSVNSGRINELMEEDQDSLKQALFSVKTNITTMAEGLSKAFKAYKDTQDNLIQKIEDQMKEMRLSLVKEEDKLRREFAEIEALMYNNEQLKTRLQSLAVPISEMNKK